MHVIIPNPNDSFSLWRGAPLLSVCAPIRDSLDDVVGIVEVFASLAPERATVDMLRY